MPKIIIDTDENSFEILDNKNDNKKLDLYSKDSFEILSALWLKTSWNQKYSYTFTWCGRPIIQHPEDIFRLQEVIYNLKPDVIIETGIAHGGSLIFYASILKAIGKGKIIGIDIDIRPHNKQALTSHELYPMISLIEGSSVSTEIINQVKSSIKPKDTTLVILDSDHSKEHVLKELNLYSKLVSIGSYIVVTDGLMRDLHNVPRGKSTWKFDNPAAAAEDFVSNNPNFIFEEPKWNFNESDLTKTITAWPCAWVKRVS